MSASQDLPGEQRSAAAAPLVVVNGCPRSGTSLLQRFLAGRFNAAVLPETHFIPIFARFLALWGDLSRPGARRALLQALYDFTEIRVRNGTALDPEQMRPYTVLGTESRADEIVAKSADYPALLETLFDEYRALHGGSVVVEKTAYYRPVSWALLGRLLPHARFIHMVRDGRDVALSWRETWFGPRSLALAASLWARHVREGLHGERAHPDRCLRLRYEDLTADLPASLARIGAFIRRPPSDEELDQSSMHWFRFVKKYRHMSNVQGALDPANFGKWRERMPAADRRTFEAVAGDALERLGYERSIARRRVPQVAARWRMLAAGVGAAFSPVEWKRRLVRWLPLPLWVSRKLGYSLPALFGSYTLVPERSRGAAARPERPHDSGLS